MFWPDILVRKLVFSFIVTPSDEFISLDTFGSRNEGNKLVKHKCVKYLGKRSYYFLKSPNIVVIFD